MKYLTFGNYLRRYREEQKLSIEEASKSLGLHRSYVSKLEHGHLKPSRQLVNKVGEVYDLKDEQLNELFLLVGYGKRGEILHTYDRKEGEHMESTQIKGTQDIKDAIEINVPDSATVMYCDAVFVTSTKYGTVLDFGQRLGSTNKHKVIARIGMSQLHLEDVVKMLKENLEQHKFDLVKKAIA